MGPAPWVYSALGQLPNRLATSEASDGAPGAEQTGLVEVDETYWGAEEEGVIGRQTERKALIAVAAEERGTGLGRIRMQRQNASAACPSSRSRSTGQRGCCRATIQEEGLPAS